MAVITKEGTFVVPPERALWLPANTDHETRHLARAQMTTLYVNSGAGPDLPRQTTVVHVEPLLRELLAAVAELPADYDESGADGRLVAVLLDRIAASRAVPLQLPMPASAPLRALAERILSAPGGPDTIVTWARSLNRSPRTLERHFKAETGVSLRTFRRQAKLFRAVELLAADHSVNEVSDRLGFEAPSAFIAMFKSAFGVTPGQYLR